MYPLGCIFRFRFPYSFSPAAEQISRHLRHTWSRKPSVLFFLKHYSIAFISPCCSPSSESVYETTLNDFPSSIKNECFHLVRIFSLSRVFLFTPPRTWGSQKKIVFFSYRPSWFSQRRHMLICSFNFNSEWVRLCDLSGVL